MSAVISSSVLAKKKPFLSPIGQRRWANFKANRRGVWSLWMFGFLFFFTLGAEFIANDRPLLMSYKGEILSPVLVAYPEEKFGGFLAVICDGQKPAEFFFRIGD